MWLRFINFAWWGEGGRMIVFQILCETQDRPETCGRPGQATNFYAYSNQYSLNLSAKGRDGEHFWGRVRILRIIFGEILLNVENLCLSAPYFRLFSWRLSAPYRLAPRASVLLARRLDRPWSDVRILCADYRIAVSALPVQIYAYR